MPFYFKNEFDVGEFGEVHHVYYGRVDEDKDAAGYGCYCKPENKSSEEEFKEAVAKAKAFLEEHC